MSYEHNFFNIILSLELIQEKCCQVTVWKPFVSKFTNLWKIITQLRQDKNTTPNCDYLTSLLTECMRYLRLSRNDCLHLSKYSTATTCHVSSDVDSVDSGVEIWGCITSVQYLSKSTRNLTQS